MFNQNTRSSQMKDRRLGMRNSGKIVKTGFQTSGGRFRGGTSNPGAGGRVNRGFGGNQQFHLHDVSKLKKLCTVTNEWIQQKSSELLDVLKRDNKSGDNSHRTVTVQSRMRGNMNFGRKPQNTFDSKPQNTFGRKPQNTFGHKPQNTFDRKPQNTFDGNFKDNNFQQNSNSSKAQNFDHPNTSHPANMRSEQNRERSSNQQERNWGFDSTNLAMKNSNQSKPSSHLFSVIEKLKMIVNSKPFNPNNAAKIFVEAVHVAGTSYTLDYNRTDKNEHRFNLIVENLVLGIGKSFTIKTARMGAYCNALKRLNDQSVADLIDNGSVPEMTNKLSHQAIIESDDSRPLSALVIIETHKTATRREKHSMSILRRSVFFSKMEMNKEISVVGNVHKVTILVQNKPVGIGLGSSVTKASINAAADALFNNFYRKNSVLQTLDEEDHTRWIPWNKIQFLSKEMETIGGHSLVSGQDISNRSFATAIQKIVDTHPWSEVNNELIFGPGMSKDCVQMLYSVAKERNLSFEGKKDRLQGAYYIVQRYYDPLDIVRSLERNGGSKGKYRLVPKDEITQIRCDHWEPTSQLMKQERVMNEVGKSKNARQKNTRLGSIPNQQKIAPNDGKEFAQMSNYSKEKEFNINPHSKDKYILPNNNDGRFDQKFTQNREMGGFNNGEFVQISRSDNEFRPMSDSCDREPKQMSWPNGRGSGQMPQTGDRGFGQVRESGDRGFGQMRESGDRGFGQMPQTDDRGFDQNRRSDDRGFEQMRRSDDRGFDLNQRSDDRGFEQMRRSDDKGFDQNQRSDDRGFEQMRRSDDRGFEQMRRPGEVEMGQMCRPDNRELNQMPGSHDREFRRMPEFNQGHGLMERGMSDNIDREFTHDKNETLGPDERRFNSNYGYSDRDLNQISNRNEREFNSQLRCNERDRGHSYDENYKQGSDINRERFNQNPNKLSDVGPHHSSNYDRRFNENFDTQVSDPDNRRYNLMLQQSKRDYDQVPCDDNRLYAQGPNYDDRRPRFNNDQPTRMDHQRNQMNSDANRGNAPWNKMQDQRGDRVSVANSRMNTPNTPHGPPQQQENMMRQNMMNLNQAANKNQLTALRFLTKKIANTALHANVKSILANARRLSNIAKARSMVENPTTGRGVFRARRRDNGTEANKLRRPPVSGNKPKTAPPILRVSQNSKITKRPIGKQSALTKSTTRRVTSQSSNANRVTSQSSNAKRVTSQSSNAKRVTSQSSNAKKVTSQSSNAKRVPSQSSNAKKVTSQSNNAKKVTSQSNNARKVVPPFPSKAGKTVQKKN